MMAYYKQLVCLNAQEWTLHVRVDILVFCTATLFILILSLTLLHTYVEGRVERNLTQAVAWNLPHSLVEREPIVDFQVVIALTVRGHNVHACNVER